MVSSSNEIALLDEQIAFKKQNKVWGIYMLCWYAAYSYIPGPPIPGCIIPVPGPPIPLTGPCRP